MCSMYSMYKLPIPNRQFKKLFGVSSVIVFGHHFTRVHHLLVSDLKQFSEARKLIITIAN